MFCSYKDVIRFRYFIRLLAIALAYPLDLHGLILKWRNYFNIEHDSEYIRVDASIVFPQQDTIPPSKTMSIQPTENFHQITNFKKLSQFTPNTRIDTTCVVLKLTPKLLFQKTLKNLGIENNQQHLDSPVPLFAVADGFGFALPVFVTNGNAEKNGVLQLFSFLFTRTENRKFAVELCF